MEKQVPLDVLEATAAAVRDACLQAALDGYERAGLSGLCEEGRWEMVVDAIKSFDVSPIVESERERAAGAEPPRG